MGRLFSVPARRRRRRRRGHRGRGRDTFLCFSFDLAFDGGFTVLEKKLELGDNETVNCFFLLVLAPTQLFCFKTELMPFT